MIIMMQALSETNMLTPRGAPLERSNSLALSSSNTHSADDLSRSSSAPLQHNAPYDEPKVDVITMRQFLVSNMGSLPLRLSVYDRDDELRVNEPVAPRSQYPLEQNTYLPLPSGQRVRVVLQSGVSEFHLKLGEYDRFAHCFLCVTSDLAGIT